MKKILTEYVCIYLINVFCMWERQIWGDQDWNTVD